jgi:hypothetical protein
MGIYIHISHTVIKHGHTCIHTLNTDWVLHMDIYCYYWLNIGIYIYISHTVIKHGHTCIHTLNTDWVLHMYIYMYIYIYIYIPSRCCRIWLEQILSESEYVCVLCVLCVLCVVDLFGAIGGPRWRYITARVSQSWPSMSPHIAFSRLDTPNNCCYITSFLLVNSPRDMLLK